MKIKGLLIATSVMAAGPAYAGGEIWDTTLSACTTADCSSVTFGATIKAQGGETGKWVAEVWAAANECLRVFVPSQYTDLKTVVVAPNGTVWRNDDGGGNNRPLVKINGTPNTGWYTVSIGHYNGVASTGDFTFAYGRYPLNNPNCSTPTAPISAPASEAAKQVVSPVLPPAK